MRTTLFPALVTCLVLSSAAADWPQQRGPARDGIVPSGEAVPTTLPDAPKVIWRGPASDGFAAPIISNGRVIFADLQNGKETVQALSFDKAKPLWQDTLDTPHKDGFGTGPRCAPVSDGVVVVAQSCKGELHCLDAKSGKLVWKTNYLSDFAAPYVGEKGKTEGAARHGYNASPCIDGDHVIALVGGAGAGAVCFDKKTGAVVWKSGDFQAAYAPPMVATIAGVEQVVCFGVQGVFGLDRKTGSVLWSVPLSTNYGRHVAAPIIVGDVVIVGSHEVGLVATRISKQGDNVTANEAWKRGKDAGPNFSSPVLVGSHIYTLSGKEVLCIDPASGKDAWRQDGLVATSPDRAFAAFLGMGEHVLMLNDTGELILFKADASAFTQVSRIQVCGKNWCHPAYADGKLVVRDAKNLICVQLLK